VYFPNLRRLLCARPAWLQQQQAQQQQQQAASAAGSRKRQRRSSGQLRQPSKPQLPVAEEEVWLDDDEDGDEDFMPAG
jgi:hypothetical protein